MARQWLLVGILLTALDASAFAQSAPLPPPATAASSQAPASAAPRVQPEPAPADAVPAGETVLGTVKLPRDVKADGKPLAAGAYELRLTPRATAEAAGPADPGRWVEFLKDGSVAGRELVTVVVRDGSAPRKGAASRPGTAKAEMTKGGDYVRVWVSTGGNRYWLYLRTPS